LGNSRHYLLTIMPPTSQLESGTKATLTPRRARVLISSALICTHGDAMARSLSTPSEKLYVRIVQ